MTNGRRNHGQPFDWSELKETAARLRKRVNRIRCMLRGYHVYDATRVGKFRYDVHGMCYDCGKVGTGQHEAGE